MAKRYCMRASSISIIEIAAMIRRKALLLRITLVCVLALASSARNAIWCNDVRLWEDVARKSPNRSRVYYNLGNEYFKSGQMHKAIDQYRRALMIRPDFGEAHNNLGSAYLALGEIDTAIGQMNIALQLDPLFIPKESYLASVQKNIDNAYKAREQARSSQ